MAEKGFFLVEANPAGFRPLDSAQLLGENECWGPLALVNGKLIIRNQKQMRYVLVR